MDPQGEPRCRISVVVLTLNEEVHIGRVLESVKWSDNVVVIDSFSNDQTPDLCRAQPNVTFLQRRFRNFADQRQYAVDSGHVRHPWILAVDADEVVPPELADELRTIGELPATAESHVAYEIPMRFYFWGRWLKHSTAYPTWWRRFYRRDRCKNVQRGHADVVEVQGTVGRTKGHLVHWNAKGLEDWLAKHNKYTSAEAEYALTGLREVPYRDLIAGDRVRRRASAKRLFRALPFPGLLRFLQLYVLQRGFLDGWRGYAFCRLRGFQHDIVRMKMRELRLEATRAETSTSPEGDGVASESSVHRGRAE